jgi:hypothetical protein
MIQVFEVNEQEEKITKLDLIEYSGRTDLPGSGDFNSRHWVIAGKVKLNSENKRVFVKMFTLEFKNDS